jgi:hypothetical protein
LRTRIKYKSDEEKELLIEQYGKDCNVFLEFSFDGKYITFTDEPLIREVSHG